MNRSPLLTALFHPVNLAMLGLAVAAGLCAAWWLAPIGFIFWIIMVSIIARDPGLQITFTRQNRQPLAQRYQVRFDRLDRARISIFNAMSQAKSPMQHLVQPLQDALDDMVEDAYQISLRMSALDNHYAVQRLSNDFTDEIASLQRKLDSSTEDATRREYGDTIRSLQHRQEQLKSLASLLDRYEAQLTGTMNAVDSVVTGVVSLKGRNPQQSEDRIAPLLHIIQTEKDELKQFDEQSQKFSVA